MLLIWFSGQYGWRLHIKKQQDSRVFWWQFPSFCDTPVGPWSLDISRLNDEPLTHWIRAIDWMSELGINAFIGNLPSYSKTGSCDDWPFGMVCEWPGYPYAKMFPGSYLEENRRVSNSIIEHCHDRGIRVFLHHYNFFAPYQWFVRQTELLERKRSSTRLVEEFGHEKNIALARSMCPNSPLYREFMKASWKELFQRLPGLDGLLITVGESNRCDCQECTGGTPVDSTWLHAVRKDQVQTFSQFARFYVETIKSIGKEPMIRCWHGGGDEAFAGAFPKGPVYVIKYSGFNSIDCGPDPAYKFWKNAGHRLWAVHEVSGAEPGGPATWLNPKWVARVNERAVGEMGIEGSVAFHNNYTGRLDMTYPPVFFNMEAAARFFNGADYEESFWKRRAEELLGSHGSDYLEAGELYSQIILNIDKVVSYPTDGISFCFNYHLVGDPKTAWPGVVGELGANGCEPLSWVRGDVAVLRRYKEYLDDAPWSEEIFEKVASCGEVEPLGFLKKRWEAAEEGLGVLQGVVVSDDDDYATVDRIIRLSAHCAVEFGRLWYNITSAKVLWWGANSLKTELETQKRLARECLACLDEVVAAMEEIHGIYYQFPSQYINWWRGLNGMPILNKLNHYRTMRREIEEGFSLLLEDKVFVWPVIGQFSWPD